MLKREKRGKAFAKMFTVWVLSLVVLAFLGNLVPEGDDVTATLILLGVTAITAVAYWVVAGSITRPRL